MAREDTKSPLYIAIAAIGSNIAFNLAFLYGTNLAHVGIALASSLSGWLNAALLGGVLRLRRQWIGDQRLVSRALRMTAASVGMGAVLWLALRVLGSQLAHANLAGVIALLIACAVGATAYGVFGAALGVVRLSELRFMLRRPASVTAVDQGEPP